MRSRANCATVATSFSFRTSSGATRLTPVDFHANLTHRGVLLRGNQQWLAFVDKLRACFERRIDIHTALLSLACCVDFGRRL